MLQESTCSHRRFKTLGACSPFKCEFPFFCSTLNGRICSPTSKFFLLRVDNLCKGFNREANVKS